MGRSARGGGRRPAPPGTAWVRAGGRDSLATENMVPGQSVYGERRAMVGGAEYRAWDPFRSKLAAAVLNGMSSFPFAEGSSVLYLGASTGTTLSHVSDIVGPRGRVFAVEHASRVAREMLDRVASRRPNVVPIVQDARRPREYSAMYGRADAVYADVAQPDQTRIALDNCAAHLRPGGSLLLVVKARSIDATRPPRGVIEAEAAAVGARAEVLEVVGLEPYDRDHAMIAARF